MGKKVEYIDGYEIPSRELTEEEKNRELTFDRFQSYHIEVGEDFLDQHCTYIDFKVFTGWLLGKYPQHAQEILETYNGEKEFGEVNSYKDDITPYISEDWENPIRPYIVMYVSSLT